MEEEEKMKNEKLKGKKGKMGKALLLFSFFIFLFSVVLSCEDPVSGEKKPKMGYVTLSVELETDEAEETDEAQGRTIMPATPSPAEFTLYILTFTNYATKVAKTLELTLEQLEDPIELEMGKYELEVTAYRDAAKTKPAAYVKLDGEDNLIVIDKGTGSKYVITLKAIIDNTVDNKPAQGTFRWVIPCNFLASTVSANMQIVSLADNRVVYKFRCLTMPPARLPLPVNVLWTWGITR